LSPFYASYIYGFSISAALFLEKNSRILNVPVLMSLAFSNSLKIMDSKYNYFDFYSLSEKYLRITREATITYNVHK
jgi:hypothetical protein